MLLIIYGASDDLIEIEGDINEEFNAIDGGVLRIDSDDDWMEVDCTYDAEGRWLISPLPVEDGPNAPWAMTIALGATNMYGKYAPTYSNVLTVDVPGDATVSLVRRKS